MTKATARQNKARELHEQLQAGIASLTSSEDWKAALDVAARFHRYSFGNTLLILFQRPDASRVAGYRKWQELGRQVRKGEQSIRILAPQSGPCRGCDGQGSKDGLACGKCGGSGRWMRFRSVSVFDIGQTEGEELPDVAPTLLEGEGVQGLWDALAAQVKAEGYTLAHASTAALGRANGATCPETRTVSIRDDLQPAQGTKTLAHELAHVLMHPDLEEYRRERDRCEVEAESVAYVVCNAQGLASADYSLPYVARWAKGEAKMVAATGERVIQTARRILDALADDETATAREAVAA